MQKNKYLNSDKEPLVSMVLPCYNAEKVIVSRVNNFLKTKFQNYELLIIDDGSTDSTYKLLIDNFSRNSKIRIFKNVKNLGVAPTKNIGIKNARGKYFSILETDQEVDPNWLGPIVKELETNPEIAGAQCKILDIDHKDRIEMCGLLFLPQTFWVVTRGLSQPSSDFNKKEYVGLGTGGSTVRLSVLKNIHMFDDNCPYSQGDSDLNWAIWMTGMKTILVPDSVIYHETFKPLSKSKVRGFYREFNFNKTPRIFLKNYQLKNIIIYLPQLIMILLIRAITHLIRGNVYPIIGLFASILWNIYIFPDTLSKRKYIQSLRKIDDNDIMKYICVKGSFLKNYYKKLRPVISAFYKVAGKNNSVMDVLSESQFRNT